MLKRNMVKIQDRMCDSLRHEDVSDGGFHDLVGQFHVSSYRGGAWAKHTRRFDRIQMGRNRVKRALYLFDALDTRQIRYREVVDLGVHHG